MFFDLLIWVHNHFEIFKWATDHKFRSLDSSPCPPTTLSSYKVSLDAFVNTRVMEVLEYWVASHSFPAQLQSHYFIRFSQNISVRKYSDVNYYGVLEKCWDSSFSASKIQDTWIGISEKFHNMFPLVVNGFIRNSELRTFFQGFSGISPRMCGLQE